MKRAFNMSKYQFHTRYEKHIELENFGEEGQKKIQNAVVAIVGMGGLGCPASLFLAAAGFGRIILIDDDEVSISNLQRQILFSQQEVGHSKISCANKRLSEFNPDPRIITHEVRVNENNIEQLLADAGMVLDCSDNFDTRYLLNEYCVKRKKILISGAVNLFDGQVYLIKNTSTLPCYKCLFPNRDETNKMLSCVDSPVFGPLVGIIGTMMAGEAIKEIVGIGPSLAGSFLSYSNLRGKLDYISFQKDSDCDVCNKKCS